MKSKTGSDFVFYAFLSMLVLSLIMSLAANRASAGSAGPSAADHDRGYTRLALSGLLEQVARPTTAR